LDISRPHIDLASKTLTTIYSGGHAGRVFVSRTFQFGGDDRLVLLREQRQDWDKTTKKYIRTISALKDGTMQAVETKVSDDGNFALSDLTSYRSAIK
jgi:hypothetical protein